jgi:hypothetical protein
MKTPEVLLAARPAERCGGRVADALPDAPGASPPTARRLIVSTPAESSSVRGRVTAWQTFRRRAVDRLSHARLFWRIIESTSVRWRVWKRGSWTPARVRGRLLGPSWSRSSAFPTGSGRFEKKVRPVAVPRSRPGQAVPPGQSYLPDRNACDSPCGCILGRHSPCAGWHFDLVSVRRPQGSQSPCSRAYGRQ